MSIGVMPAASAAKHAAAAMRSCSAHNAPFLSERARCSARGGSYSGACGKLASNASSSALELDVLVRLFVPLASSEPSRCTRGSLGVISAASALPRVPLTSPT
jgi:hypothetical protein